MCYIVPILFFYKDDFGIKYPTKIDMPLNKEPEANMNTSNHVPTLLDSIIMKY